MRLNSKIVQGDLVWIRNQGIYYLGRVGENSKWQYCDDNEILKMDAANQRNNIEWVKIGDESDVPGAIATSFIQGQTLQKIKKPGALLLSKVIWNEKAEEKKYKIDKLTFNEKNFYSVLSTEDCEDLLCLWLYSEYGYITIPSTNKKSTELYECVLVNPENGKHIYPQVKTGEVKIDARKYIDIAKEGEVWLFTANGKVTGIGECEENIKVACANKMFEFVKTEIAQKILPKSIINWYKWLQDINKND